jgi:hypothetical protein
MIVRVIQCSKTPPLHKFQLFKNSEKLGHCKTIIQDRAAVLTDLEIYDPHKHKGWGTNFLRETESILKKQYYVRSVSLLAWQPSGSSNVVDFFKKNQYQPLFNEIGTYDDSVTLFDLHHMYKTL